MTDEGKGFAVFSRMVREGLTETHCLWKDLEEVKEQAIVNDA